MSSCPPCASASAKRLVSDHAFRGFTPEGVAVSGSLVAGVTVLLGLAGSAIHDFRRDGPLSSAMAIAYLVVAITFLTVIVAGLMDKRKNVRAGFIVTVSALAAGLAGGAFLRYRAKKLGKSGFGFKLPSLVPRGVV